MTFDLESKIWIVLRKGSVKETIQINITELLQKHIIHIQKTWMITSIRNKTGASKEENVNDSVKNRIVLMTG